MIEEHDDDKPVGRLMTRREALKLLSGGSLALFMGTGLTKLASLGDIASAGGTATPSASGTPGMTPTAVSTAVPTCIVRPALTEGPYFVDVDLNRSDIRIEPSDESVKEGTTIWLGFKVFDVTSGTCTPLSGAQVDIWHCDAEGAYSGVSDPGFDTSEFKWLRGWQVTDEKGEVEFISIYPGWYSGRTVHIHFKIRTDPESETGYEFTSQLFFDETLTDKVHSKEPYAEKGMRDTLNEDDNIFQGSEDLLTLDLREYEDEEMEEKGYKAVFGIGLDLSNPPEEQGGGGAPGGGGPGRGTPPGGHGTPPPRN
jgi:protocatechuate 3,4-dioxygenase beta subunit